MDQFVPEEDSVLNLQRYQLAITHPFQFELTIWIKFPPHRQESSGIV